jgi:hypothetical protein
LSDGRGGALALPAVVRAVAPVAAMAVVERRATVVILPPAHVTAAEPAERVRDYRVGTIIDTFA